LRTHSTESRSTIIAVSIRQHHRCTSANLVQLIIMRHLQEAGHHPIALVGGATGLIGDPRQSGERILNPKDIVEQWV
jgi:hypothetical protein